MLRTLCRTSARRALTRVRTYASDEFINSTSANYVDEMYAEYKKNPESVHASWRAYFKNIDGGASPSQAFQAPPNLSPLSSVDALPTQGSSEVLDHLKVQMLVRAFQVQGHFRAKVDPLKRILGYNKEKVIPETTLEYYGFSESDLDREVQLGPGILPRFAENGKTKMTIREVYEALKQTYSSSYGIQYMHIPSRDKCDWIRERVEIPTPFKFSKEQKHQILDRLMWASLFESFLASKFPNDKRFGLEGGESLVPGMKTLIDSSVDRGVEAVVMGMPHRGRLNVLSNVVRKPHVDIFSEFSGSAVFDEGSGDVKYHLGMNYVRPTTNGRKVYLSLAANPSHLEAEDPVVLGHTRAIHHAKKDVGTYDKAMSVLLHGDAAVEAQGVVYESLGTAKLKNYSTGGTVHIIINNQIGFTTDPSEGRSTPYPSDFARTIDAPIFHVNGDDIESVTFIFDLAAQWRYTFKEDVIIDLICYRKHGHNEIDQPSFTQPMMYKRIAEKVPPLEQYEKKLIDEGTFTEQEIKEHRDWIWNILEEQFQLSKKGPVKDEEKKWVSSEWKDFKDVKALADEVIPHLPTAIDEKDFKEIGKVASSWPENFNVHRNLKRILKARGKSIESGEGIDWSTGEALAFGSLLKEGFQVRVSGQDVERGTFSQRHAVLHDQDSYQTVTPLKQCADDPENFSISNSHLSEYGVLGFEYGYSLMDPRNLVMWEAQFGDFANTAQVIIDQFVASAESKWQQRSGIVLSLPHGYDGQGPEHSSARIERYLQLCNEDPRAFPSPEKLQRQHQDCNIQVAYPTTPANYFHLLRRQQHRQFRKPLINIFSKSLLRHPLARSNIEDFIGDSGFKWVIDDTEVGKNINKKDEIKRVVVCSGQVYVGLHKARADNKVNDTALIRIEQLHPFPYAQLKEVLDSYPNVSDFVWCQEEPLNAGAFSFVQPRLRIVLEETDNHKNSEFRYAGRDPSASVAAGAKAMHKNEEELFLKSALQFA